MNTTTKKPSGVRPEKIRMNIHEMAKELDSMYGRMKGYYSIIEARMDKLERTKKRYKTSAEYSNLLDELWACEEFFRDYNEWNTAEEMEETLECMEYHEKCIIALLA